MQVTTIIVVPQLNKMRRGFLNSNQPKSKSKSNPKQPVIPNTVVLPQSSDIAAITVPRGTGDNPTSQNLILSEGDVQRWAHKLCQPETTFKDKIGSQLARVADSDFKMVYRNLTFKQFQGVVFTDAMIYDLIPSRFETPRPALENAYKISEAVGKGLGMFATRDIPAGAVILVENPVFVFPSISSLGISISRDTMFKTMFDRLVPDVRERALLLWNSKPANVCGKEEGIIRTNGFGLDLAVPKIANPPDGQHSGTFMDLSRCNHR